jgi:DNA mismatch endonuclease (patch repair protein)
MVDVLTPAQRKLNMSRIRGKDTKPEMVVRRLLHALGYRYRLHRRDLPGTPDIVFGPRRKVINVHGCYWHVHACQYGRVKPASNATFWAVKRAETVLRDQRNERRLQDLGWDVLTIWECETKSPRLSGRIVQFLNRGDAKR